jgi:hypothetical protein
VRPLNDETLPNLVNENASIEEGERKEGTTRVDVQPRDNTLKSKCINCTKGDNWDLPRGQKNNLCLKPFSCRVKQIEQGDGQEI